MKECKKNVKCGTERKRKWKNKIVKNFYENDIEKTDFILRFHKKRKT